MGTKILSIETHFPEKTLTNEQLSLEFGRWDPDKIESKVGIRQRHIAAKEETAGDMAALVGEKILQSYDKDKIDFLFFCTQSPDYFLPTTACILQNKLQLRTNIGAFDFNLGCSGYIYGLALAKAFINAKLAKSILLLTSETYSKHIHARDLANRTIFGDAATATILEYSDQENIFEFVFGTDGSGMNNLIVPNGCFRNAFDFNPTEITSESGDIYTKNNLIMNGPEIFNFTIASVPILFEQCLIKNNLDVDDLDFVIFHQANKYIIEYLRKKINIPPSKFYSNIIETGNTVSSTIPIALLDSINTKKVKTGDRILLCGFGVGYSWGAVIIEI